jgi:hypothetical protein
VETLRDIAPLVALAAAALAVALFVLLIVLAVRIQRLRQAQLAVLGQHGQRDLVAHAEELDAQVRTLREAVEQLTLDLNGLRTRLDDTLTHRALVRYDAFRDAGGEQSASLALLDDHRSGFVLSTIAARDFARVYVKYLHAGVPDKDLSPEEREAVAVAVPEPLPDRRPKAGDRGPVPGDEEPPAAEGDASPHV